MKGKYKTKDGSIVQVAEFDEKNKSVRVGGAANIWYPEKEYSQWESLEQAEVEPFIEVAVPIEDEQPIVKEPVAEKKPKRTYKKKTK